VAGLGPRSAGTGGPSPILIVNAGSSSLKIGYQGSLLGDIRSANRGSNALRYRVNNGVPNQLTMFINQFQNDLWMRDDAFYALAADSMPEAALYLKANNKAKIADVDDYHKGYAVGSTWRLTAAHRQSCTDAGALLYGANTPMSPRRDGYAGARKTISLLVRTTCPSASANRAARK
jgi:hypothetical protein